MLKIAHKYVMYFNYHAKAKKLIDEGKLTCYKFVEKWNNISPALVLFFKNNKPMPIRQDKWEIYLKIIKEKGT